VNDTPDHIKALQLKISLYKPPMERLRQMMKDNEALFKFWATSNSSSKTINEAVKKN